jgi:hypothetical protein
MITTQWYFLSKYLLFYAIFALLILIPAVCVLFMLIHYGFCSIYVFLYKIFKYLKDNEYICKTVQKKQVSSLRFGTGRIFVDRTGPAD